MEEDGRGGENCYKVAIFTPLLFIIRVEFSRAPPPPPLAFQLRRVASNKKREGRGKRRETKEGEEVGESVTG